jgi:hypothetical protein
VTWFRRRAPEEASGELRAAIAELRTEIHALRRDVDDLDESFRRFRSRRAKQDAVDGVESPPNGAHLPTLAQLRSQGRLPWRNG